MWYDEFGIMTQEQVSMTRNAYQILLEGASAEIVEKKSRFIATIRPVKTEEEASAFIEKMKKQYWDARHNCSAFVVGENNCITRCSDDGEPSGTAGRPMLEVLLGSGITNIAVVVTRYFGGVLLGAGGLVRAYSSATVAAIEAAGRLEMHSCTKLTMRVPYALWGRVEAMLHERAQCVQIASIEYEEEVKASVWTFEEEAPGITDAIIDRTDACVRPWSEGHDVRAFPASELSAEEQEKEER